MKVVIRKWIGLLAASLGFVSSVIGIYSWVSSILHFGAIYIPNPIVIVIAVVIALALVVVAFVLGGFYMISMLISGIFRAIDPSLKVPWYLVPIYGRPKPKGTPSIVDRMKSSLSEARLESEQKQQLEPPQELPKQ